MRKRISTLVTATALMTVAATAGLYGQGPDRSGPPKPGAPPTLSLPAIQQLELSNGLSVMLVEKHTVPLVQLNLVVRVGAAYDPSDRIGLARMTADMMDEGAAGMDALALADASTVSVASGWAVAVVVMIPVPSAAAVRMYSPIPRAFLMRVPSIAIAGEWRCGPVTH